MANHEQEHSGVAGMLVSDFDGTLTRHDFFRLAIVHLVPPETADYWQAYRDGRLTHFQAMQSYYASIRASEDDTLRIAQTMDLQPHLAEWVNRLSLAGWKVIVASAGCAWYIDYLLKQQDVQLEVHANPGRFVPGQGLLLELPVDSPYYSPSHGIDKAAVVRAAQRSCQRVAFAGDGYPDISAARLADAELRFATGALASSLQEEGLAFHRFERWAEVAQTLIDMSVL